VGTPPTIEDIKASLTEAQISRLEEVAALLLQIYRTIARMRYTHIQPQHIRPGPHPIPPTLMTYYYTSPSINLDPCVIYLYHILPYIENGGPHGFKSGSPPIDLFMGSEVVDFRNPHHVQHGRQPFWSDEPEQALRPWMTLLSASRNHGCAMAYDARTHRIGISDQCSGWPEFGDCTLDPALNRREWKRKIASGWFSAFTSDVPGALGCVYEEDEGRDVDYDEDWEEVEEWQRRVMQEGGVFEGEEEYQKRCEELGPCVWDEMTGRPAGDFLRDVNEWFRRLILIPGENGEDAGVEWSSEYIRPLYRKHGWPSEDFDGDAWEIDMERAKAADRAKYEAEEPIRAYENREASAKNRFEQEQTERQEAERSLVEAEEALDRARGHNVMPNQAKKDNEEAELNNTPEVDEIELENRVWEARWKLFEMDKHHRSRADDLKHHKQVYDRLCPGGVAQRPEDLPLWELRQLRLNLANDPGNEKLQKAEKASRADAERLCGPDRVCDFSVSNPTHPSKLDSKDLGVDLPELRLERKDSDKRFIEGSRQDLKERREWLDSLPPAEEPDRAGRARKLALEAIARDEENIGRWTIGPFKYFRMQQEKKKKAEEAKAKAQAEGGVVEGNTEPLL